MKYTALTLFFALLTACAPPDKPTVSLYLAMKRGDLDQIERHIRWGTDLNRPLPESGPPLHMAASAGKPIITKLLLKNGADPDLIDQNGHTALYRALESGRTQVAAILLKGNAKMEPDRMLHSLIDSQVTDRDVIAFLIDNGANLDAADEKAPTPLTRAIALNNLLLTKLLIRAGADVNKPDGEGKTPLSVATEGKNPDIIRLLHRHGAATE